MEPSTVSRSQPRRRILGLETSSSHCEIALADDTTVHATAQLPQGSKPTSTLIPAIRELLRQVHWSPLELDLVCVDVGPGSFTGLRVGLTCAKTFAFAAGAPLATVDSLAIVAQNVTANERSLEIAFDAARGQVFASRFRREVLPQTGNTPSEPWQGTRAAEVPLRGTQAAAQERLEHAGVWAVVDPVQILDAPDWALRIDQTALVIGPALVKYRHLLPDHRVAAESLWWPRASSVIKLGALQFQTDPLPSYWTLEPLYLRPSAAEEKKASAQGG